MLTDQPFQANDPGIDRILAAGAQAGIPVNIMCSGKLPLFLELARRHPDTQMVVDHVGIAQPSEPPAPPEPFGDLANVVSLAAYDNVAIKISGACTLSHQSFPYADIWEPFLEHLEKVTGKDVHFFAVQSNSAEVEAMRSGRLHVAGFSTGPTPFAVNLAGADLTGCNLSGAKLKNANLKGARLKDSLLVGTDLTGANLRNVDLTSVDLSQANIANSIGSKAVTPLPEDIRELINSHTEWLTSGGSSGVPLNVTGRDLTELDFSGLDLSAACFDDCILKGALFVDAILAMTSMRNADLRNARLSGAIMNGVRMSYANCAKAICQGVRFGGVEQRDAKGNKTGDVWRADLTAADFSHADLRNSVFEAPQMKGAILSKANIAGVAFGETDLSEVELTGTNIGAILSGTIPEQV